MENKPNQVIEVLCEVIYDCFRKGCPKFAKQGCGDCDVVNKALTKLGEIVERCIPEDKGQDCACDKCKGHKHATKVYRTILTQAGFPLNNKGGENGK